MAAQPRHPDTGRVLSEQTRLGLVVLGGAFAIGIAADALLRAGPWGISFSLFVIAMVIVLLVVARWQRVSLRRSAWLAVPAVAFALTFAWRDSPHPASSAVAPISPTIAIALALPRPMRG